MLAPRGDYASLMRLWNFIEARFESHLEEHLVGELASMRTALQRYFVVHSIKASRVADALEFLEAHVRRKSPPRVPSVT